ncbi:hypothetical protein C0J52_05573 [Blattella germanica]|nr:hypothetical protein C0J52_05573 [Blattella germanica]
MVAQSYVGMKVYQNENAVLPCIPTSPYVNIHLYKDGELLKPGKLPDSETTVTFDRTVGFTLQPFTVSQSGLYTCVAIAKVGLQGTFSEELPISVMAENNSVPVNSGYVLEAPYIQKYFVTIIFPLLLSHYSKFNI